MRVGHFRRLLVIAVGVPLALASAAEAQVARDPGAQPGSPEPQSKVRARLGLVLSGGGARGAAHIGVLQVLDELRVPVHAVAGTSMGAIVGGLLALGRSPAELEQVVERIDWVDVFRDGPDRNGLSFRRKQDDLNFLTALRLGFRDGRLFIPAGFIEGQKLSQWLRRLTLVEGRSASFADLHLPFEAVATDIETGQEVRLRSGDLPSAMRASMSIPGVFTPVDRNRRRLVDGMLANNVPVDSARALGAERFVVVDVSTPLKRLDELDSAFAISEQSLDVVTARKRREQLAHLEEGRDVVIRPSLGEIGVGSFTALPEAIEAGRQAARRRAESLRRFAVPEAEYQRWLDRVRRPEPPPPRIEAIAIDNGSRLSDAAVRARMSVEAGEALDFDALFEDLSAIFGTDAMEFVDFDLQQGTTGSLLTIHTQERLRGRHYLRFGLNLDTSFGDDSVYNVAVNHVAQPLDSWGLEWRTLVQLGSTMRANTELYQPLGPQDWFFVLPRLEFQRAPISIFSGRRRIARYDVQLLVPSLLAGVNLGRSVRLQAGVGWVEGDNELDIGDPAVFDDEDYDGGIAQVEFDLDTLDNTSFPNDGVLARVRGRFFREELGWASAYETLEMSWSGFRTWGRNTLGLSVEYNTTFRGGERVQALFDLGGFGRLSSFQVGERVGRHTGLARVVGYRRVLSPALLSWEFPVYLGASFEVGDAWEDRSDIEDDLLISGSLFLGAETPLGPLYLAYGVGERGTQAAYLFLGRRF